MPREVLKPLYQSQLNTTYTLNGTNKSNINDKENKTQRDVNQTKRATSKVLATKVIPKNNQSSSVNKTNVSSSIAGIEPLRAKTQETYPLTQFSIYNEAHEDSSNDNNNTKMLNRSNHRSLFEESKEFFLNQEKKALNRNRFDSESNRPLAAKALIRIPSTNAFKKAKESFIIREESEKIQKELQFMMEKNYSDDKNVPKITNRRIVQLQSDNSVLNQDYTPYDPNFALPSRETIKLEHKKKNIESIIRPDAPLSTSSFTEIHSIAYNEDILKFYLQKETTRQRIHPNFKRQNINTDQRRILVGHLLKIIKDYNYSSFLTYPAVKLLDDMLDAKRIPLEKLQLVELTSMWLVMKNSIVHYVLPDVEKIIAFSGNAYKKEEIFECEKSILKTMNFEISYPDPFSVLSHNLIAHNNFMFTPQDMSSIYYSGCYMLEVVLFDEELMKLSALLLGGTAAELALMISISPEEAFMDLEHNQWRSDFTRANFTLAEILSTQSLILRRIILSSYRHTPEHVVFKKYKRSQYKKISYVLILNIGKILPS